MNFGRAGYAKNGRVWIKSCHVRRFFALNIWWLFQYFVYLRSELVKR